MVPTRRDTPHRLLKPQVQVAVLEQAAAEAAHEAGEAMMPLARGLDALERSTSNDGKYL